MIDTVDIILISLSGTLALCIILYFCKNNKPKYIEIQV